MDASSFDALLIDPSKCSELSMEKKRELVYEVSHWTDRATEILHAWSRQEILQILCAELGKERKCTGFTKSKIIEQLLKIVDEKKTQDRGTENISSENGERIAKRQRKSDHPTHLTIATCTPDADLGNPVYCKNSACKAKLNSDNKFCKRCSCCICRAFDDNKDPSLWLICNSDPPFHGMSCGMSCHLECALQHEKSGTSKDGQDKALDGSFFCASCRKVNDLLGCWRKQLVVARDTRRVDILCYRLSLCQKILSGTKDYQNLCGYVDEAVSMLEKDVGPLTGLPVKMARGIVNRLSSGPEIQRLCASAVESLDSMLSQRVSITPYDCNEHALKLVRFEEIRASSITVIRNSDDSTMGNGLCYMLWHRKADERDYRTEPTCRLFTPDAKRLLSNLTPATDYLLKVAILDKDIEMWSHEFQFRTENSNSTSSEIETCRSPATNCSSLSNPSSVEDDNNNVLPCSNEEENQEVKYLPFTGKGDEAKEKISLLDEENSIGKDAANSPMVEEISTDNGPRNGFECIPYADGQQITLESEKEGGGRKNIQKNNAKGSSKILAISSSSKKCVERPEECSGDLGYYVKVVRCLEHEGHIETEFREKFLRWYSLRASHQEVRIVKAFIDTFIEDHESLAGQLVDTFSGVASDKRCSTVPSGFCLKLWH